MADAKQADSGAKPQPGRAQATAPPPSSEPTVSGFRVSVRRTRGVKDMSTRFSELSFVEMNVEGDTLNVLNVESRDLRKDPALFSIIRFKPDSVECTYTCLANMSPKKRRLEVLRHFLNMLTLVEDCHEVSIKQVYQILESAINDMSEYVTLDYEKLFSLYDNLKAEFSAMQKKVKDFTESSSQLSKENYELKNRNDELVLKVKALETLSDSVLTLKIQEWLSEHRGEINIAEFSKVYNVSEMRVEQMLNKMVTEGFLETKG